MRIRFNISKRNRCYQLVGIPAAGKSTWVRSQNWANKCTIVSTDYFVEQEALSQGLTYSEIFASYMPTAIQRMSAQVVAARNDRQDIIWDQTSTTVSSRLKKFRMLPEYEHIAVVFKTPSATELQQRLNSRPGKNIPTDVIQTMIAQFEQPTIAEGFKEIWFAE